jgi:hypothetical protein
LEATGGAAVVGKVGAVEGSVVGDEFDAAGGFWSLDGEDQLST